MKTVFVTILGATLMLLATSQSGAVTLGFDPSAPAVTVGSAVNVAVVISGLGSGAAPSLSTFDLNVTFDSGILSFLGVTFGDPILGDQLDLSGFGTVTDVVAGAGVVNVFELSFDSVADLNDLQAAGFTLGTLSFNALSAGVSALGITVNALGDADGSPLAADVVAGQVVVTGVSVPGPAPLLLLFAAVVGFVAFRAAVGVRLGAAARERARREPDGGHRDCSSNSNQKAPPRATMRPNDGDGKWVAQTRTSVPQ